MHAMLKGSYIPVREEYTTKDTDRYINFQQSFSRDAEVKALRSQLEALENVREVQSRIIKKLSR